LFVIRVAGTSSSSETLVKELLVAWAQHCRRRSPVLATQCYLGAGLVEEALECMAKAGDGTSLQYAREVALIYGMQHCSTTELQWLTSSN
jgi:hypothetical protein